jgi:hypothetical protein
MSISSIELARPEALSVNYPMSPGEVKTVNVDGAPYNNAYQTHAEVGIHAPTVAKVIAGGHQFSIVDVRDVDDFATPLVVADENYKNRRSSQGMKGIWPDTPVVVGRNHHNNRFNYQAGVSRDHFSVAYNGLGLLVRNLAPTNSTLLSGDITIAAREGRLHKIIAEFTHRAEDDAQQRFDSGPKDEEAPYGYYKNHPIIGRNSTTVKNGVYFTTTPNSEAVVVDDKSKVLQQLRCNLEVEFDASYGRRPLHSVANVLDYVNQFTSTVMPYSIRKSDRLSSHLYEDNKLIGLSEYVEAGGGVCRHQCLLAAFLMESLVEKGILLGQAGVERNHDVDANGAHAWAVFKAMDGQSYVIDPAQNYVGTKMQARLQGRWKYDLPANS